ncbi:MAG: hypothetical protein IPM56_12790 [Ignavibacteriales bacterium]|nr:MAG: hypothetical protein IPM56_12790 [Ignavibacteriales bacterium]
MKKIFGVVTILLLIVSIQGCLSFNTISYDIVLNEDGTGSATALIKDIKSLSKTDSEFEEDKQYLFEYIYKSSDFIKEIKREGKNIKSRELFADGNKLNGRAEFTFTDISDVEGIQTDEGFYYSVLSLGDSIVSTTGTIIVAEDHKKILWDKSFKNLKFEIFSEDTKGDSYRALLPYLNE